MTRAVRPIPSPALTGYAFGRLDVDGQPHSRDLIALPGRVVADWRRLRGHRLQVPDLEAILADPPQRLIIGQGHFGRMKVDERAAAALREAGIRFEALWTAKAVARYMELRERERVGAALHLTC